MPGVHRLVFENGQVLLTLGVGDAKSLLKAQSLVVDSVYLDGFSPQRNPDIWDVSTLKAVARCCRRGTRLASWTVARSVLDGLQQCGFEVRKTLGVAPKRDNLQACFNPSWALSKRGLGADRATDGPVPEPTVPTRCVVIGAGLAGAACAASLARRGWQVSLIDALAGPAGGASALPAGLLAPHVSPDDSLLSKLSRSGLRATWQTVTGALQPGLDFQMTGVLQRRFEASGALPAAWPEAAHEWSRIASAAELAEVTKGATGAEVPGITQQAAPETNGSGNETTPAGLWHGAGGWIKPWRLVQAMLNTPGITPLYGATVARLKQVVIEGHPSYWQVLDSLGNCLAEAELVVLAAGFDTARLVTATNLTDDSQPIGALPLQAIRGQVAWGKAQRTTDMPPFPVNGHGSFIPGFIGADGQLNWLMGATFERHNTSCEITPGDQHSLAVRLQTLLPRTASKLESAFQEEGAQAWAGVRCASPDRLPVVGPLNETLLPGLWVCSALGSRGLTFAVLCAELLASWLHTEPLPIENRLAQALRVNRFSKS